MNWEERKVYVNALVGTADKLSQTGTRENKNHTSIIYGRIVADYKFVKECSLALLGLVNTRYIVGAKMLRKVSRIRRTQKVSLLF
jgi:hypothetical protein